MIALLLLADATAAPYAVVVGTDTPPPGRPPLRYAEADAEAVRDVLIDVGGFDADRVALLRDPTPDALLAAIADSPDADTFLLYYSGHADTEALFPGGRPLSILALKQALDAVPAQVRIGVVDACQGGGWTGAKGPTAVAPFAVPSLASAGTAYLAASSGAEDAHELEVLGGSVFSHHRGAADTDADGLITLGESFDWARARTIHDSTVLAGTTQHPSFHLDVRGRQDVVLADLRGARSAVELRWDRGALAVYALDTGVHVADLPEDRQPASLVLPPGRYVARRSAAGEVDVAEFVVQAGVPEAVDPDRFVRLDPGLVAMKGDGSAAIDQLSPARGGWLVHAGVGSEVAPDPTGTLDRYMRVRTGLVYGITDRVSVSFPFGAGLRLGRPDGFELLVTGGFRDGGVGFGYAAPGGLTLGIYGDLGGGVDVRRPLSPMVGLVASGWTESSTSLSTALVEVLPPRLGAALGPEIHLGPKATFRPSVGAEQRLGPDGGTGVTFGGALRRGSRPLPLVQFQLAEHAWLDLDYAVQLDLDRLDQPTQVGFVGVTATWGGHRTDAE
ncbi:MAG: caspase family protein [Myxococcota bacterium]